MKILRMSLLLLTGILLIACSKEYSDRNTNDKIIYFYCSDIQSKSSIINSVEDIQNGDGFRVYAHASFTVDETETNISFNRNVTYNEGWTYEEPEYWVPGGYYTFWAFYPNDLEVEETTANGFNFTLDDISTQTDILHNAQDRDLRAEFDYNAVEFQFSHLLANVNLKLSVQDASMKVTVSSVSLNGVNKAGTCSREQGSTGPKWAILSENGTVDLAYTFNPTKTLNITPTLINNNGFLVIPQKVSGEEIKFVINLTNNGVEKVYNCPIPNIVWEIGNKYIYNVVINQEGIVFKEPTVVEWDEENATGSVIIK